ncbi:MAG: XrtA system polysaccharide deacetylase [Bacteroidota bacterium]
MLNAFTIDLEEWFCSHNLQDVVQPKDWEQLETRVGESTHYLLDLLESFNVTATFFVLGWIAEKYPDLVAEIAAKGHEIASHGYGHQLLTHMTPENFRDDLRRSVETIESATGQVVQGYRAPAFSVTQRTQWSITILSELGFKYDSSVYPLSWHPDYGNAQVALTPFLYDNQLLEIPMSCVTVGRWRVPCSGGAYFRLLPYAIYRRLIHRLHAQRRSLIFYLHPWEVDSDLPRLPTKPLNKFRHYTALRTVKPKLTQLLTEFTFTSLSKLITYG